MATGKIKEQLPVATHPSAVFSVRSHFVHPARSIAQNNISLGNGFQRQSTALAARDFATSFECRRVVVTMTLVSGAFCYTSSNTWYPLMPGMIRSVMTISKPRLTSNP